MEKSQRRSYRKDELSNKKNDLPKKKYNQEYVDSLNKIVQDFNKEYSKNIDYRNKKNSKKNNTNNVNNSNNKNTNNKQSINKNIDNSNKKNVSIKKDNTNNKNIDIVVNDKKDIIVVKKKKNILIYVILIFLVILNILLVYSNNNLKDELDISKESYKEVSKKYSNNNIDNSELREYVNILNNLDDYIDKEKKEYFDTLKIFEDKVYNKEINYKIAYLTFDDGPYYSTYSFLDVLDKYDAFATFFTTNVNGSACYDNKSYNCHSLYLEYLKYGHTIANHTYTHSIRGGLYSNADNFINAIKNQENFVKEQTGGYTTNIMRYPGGSGTANAYGVKYSTLAKLKEMGYGWVDWTAQDGDGGWVGDTTTAWNNLVPTLNDNIEVVLFHDYSKVTLAILPKTIEYLEDNGYVLAPLFYESRMVNK